jgi:ubiquinone/menaquinone biosynthesis C-methylase UbiE
MDEKVCPVWVGYLLASPLRRMFQNPVKILAPHIKKDMKVLDVGSAMGFFSLPAARMVGDNGKVVCVDMQKKMLKVLAKRSRKAKLQNIIVPHQCTQKSLCIDGWKRQIDFAFAIALVHEVPDKENLFCEIRDAMKPAAQFLIAEPKGHVTEKEMDNSLQLAENAGFVQLERGLNGYMCYALMQKKGLFSKICNA